MGRSKKAIQEALDLFNKAMSGDADACIKIWEIMQDAEKRAREDEYKRMRQALLEIVEAADTTNADRIAAINTIYKMDAEGVPLPQGW